MTMPIQQNPNTHTNGQTPRRKPSEIASTKQTVAARLRQLRLAAGLSQEAIGAQGFISAPGWIKIENGQRTPSEKLLDAFAMFLVGEKVVRAHEKDMLFEELCSLKYAAYQRGPFLARLAKEHLLTLAQVTVAPPALTRNRNRSKPGSIQNPR